jgi:membrane fusion protein, multidrug efflux system
MKAKRTGMLMVGAAVAAAAAYFFWPQLGASIGALEPKAAGKRDEGKARGAAAAPVTAVQVMEKDMPMILKAPGTVEPLANVSVKPRVDGQIVEVAFREGDIVKAGDVLFRLDDRIVKALIAQAEAAIARDQASLRDAEATLTRREALIDRKIVSEAALDQARYAVEGLRASINAGKAMLESQKTQLDYLTIRAPITGRTGSLAAKLGATVRSADAQALVTINQTQPINVGFAVPQSELGALRRALANKAPAEVIVADGAEPNVVRATIGFVDNQVDRTTGTVTAKVVAENADEILWPGQSVEVALTVEVRARMLSVPAAAVLPAQQGMITWVIGPDNKVMPRVVTVARIVGQVAYLSGGVSVGDRVVTDGQIRLAPGARVTVEEPRRAPGAAPATPERSADGRG